MIKVNFKKLNAVSSKLGDKLLIDTANVVGKQYADWVEKNIKDKKCEHHPNATQYIDIIAVKGTIPNVVKRSFCCDEFKNGIVFTFK